MLNKGGGAEHYLYITLRNLPYSGHRKLCPQRGPVVVAVSTKVKCKSREKRPRARFQERFASFHLTVLVPN